MDVCRLLRSLGPVVCAVALLTGAAPVAMAQTNDNFANAFALGFGDPDSSVSNVGFTFEDQETVLCADVNNDFDTTKTAWWGIVGSGRPVTLSTAGSDFDSILAVYTDGPTFADQKLCVDGDPNETASFDSQLDQIYYVQVGGCFSTKNGLCGAKTDGNIRLLATTPPPPNDNRANAMALSTGASANGDNVGATEQPGEPLQCGTPAISFGRTIWYLWHAPGAGTATLTATGYDPVVAVYRGDATTASGCVHAAQKGPGQAMAQLPVEAGDYYVQVAGYGAHDPATLADAQQSSMTVGAAFVPSAPAPAAHPAPPAGSPDAPSVQGSKQAVTASMRLTSYVVHTSRSEPSRRFTALRLIASDVSTGTRIEMHCSGRGCPFAVRSLVARRAYSRLALGGKALRRARLRNGAVVEVRISKPGLIGRVTTYRIRAGRLPVRSAHCTSPGTRRVTSCPA
jgi:hypothetical protein